MTTNIIHRLHDRSGRRSFRYNQREAQVLPSDHIDVLTSRLAKLEQSVTGMRSDLDKANERIRDLESEICVLCKKVADKMDKTRTEGDGVVAEAAQTSNSVIKSFVRIGRLLKRRTTVEKLKAKNIYKNEACFDTEIESVVKHPKYPTVPKILVECVELIEAKARLNPTDGLYRVSGDCVHIQQIRFDIDNDNYDCLKRVKDVHTVVGVLKLFLREIKSPLIDASEIWRIVGSDVDSVLRGYKVEDFQTLARNMSEVKRDTLCYFVRHLHKLCRMNLPFTTMGSLAMSVGPSVFQSRVDYCKDIGTHIRENVVLNDSLEFMIANNERIFK